MGDLSVHEAIFTTRSMRHLKPDPVSREDLEYIIEAATMAPSAGNTQMWAFVVVTDPEQIAKIGAAYRDVGRALHRRWACWPTRTSRPTGSGCTRRRCTTSSTSMSRRRSSCPACTVARPDNSDVSSGFFSSTYPAVQNILLAARERGLGTVLLTLATDYSPVKPEATAEVRDVLGLPDDVTITALIPVGYPQGPWGRPWRKPWQESHALGQVGRIARINRCSAPTITSIS